MHGRATYHIIATGNPPLMHSRVVKQAVLLALVTLAGSLHPRNAFTGSYDMPALVSACPALQVAFTVDLSLALLP